MAGVAGGGGVVRGGVGVVGVGVGVVMDLTRHFFLMTKVTINTSDSSHTKRIYNLDRYGASNTWE